MNGFERRREQKKQAILKAASAIFLVKGYKSTSVEEIAAQAQVSPVSIYKFFETKAKLYAGTIEAMMIAIMDQYDEILTTDQSFLEKLGACIQCKLSQANIASPDFLTGKDIVTPEITDIILKMNETRIIPMFFKLVEQGKNEGVISPEIDTNSVLLYINMFTMAMTDSRFVEPLRRDDKLARDISKLFLFGFAGTGDATLSAML